MCQLKVRCYICPPVDLLLKRFILFRLFHILYICSLYSHNPPKGLLWVNNKCFWYVTKQQMASFSLSIWWGLSPLMGFHQMIKLSRPVQDSKLMHIGAIFVKNLANFHPSMAIIHSGIKLHMRLSVPINQEEVKVEFRLIHILYLMSSLWVV